MTLLKHKNARDVAISIVGKKAGHYIVEFWNINYTKISGKKPLYLGMQEIPCNKIKREDYSPWEY